MTQARYVEVRNFEVMSCQLRNIGKIPADIDLKTANICIGIGQNSGKNVPLSQEFVNDLANDHFLYGNPCSTAKPDPLGPPAIRTPRRALMLMIAERCMISQMKEGKPVPEGGLFDADKHYLVDEALFTKLDFEVFKEETCRAKRVLPIVE